MFKAKIMWKYLHLLSIASVFNLNAQIRSQGFMSIKNPYEFNIPQLGVGLKLPANAGFIVPILDGEDVMLEVDDKTYYYLNLDYLANKETNKFFFSATNDTKNILQLEVVRCPNLDLKGYIADWHKHPGYIKDLKGFKSNIPVRYSCQFTFAERILDMYAYSVNDYMFIFYLDNESPNRAAHEKIVSSFGKRNLQQQLRRYETRVEFGYYDEDNKGVTDYNPENPYRKITGIAMKERKVSIPSYQLNIDLPQGCYYEFHGRNLIEKPDGTYLLDMDQVDVVGESMHFYWLRGRDLSIMGRYSDKKSHPSVNFNTMGYGLKDIYGYTKDIRMLIDGIEVEGIFYGSREKGDLHLWFETGEGYHSFTISGLVRDNLSSYDRIIETIQIQSETKKKGVYTSFLDVLELKPKGSIDLDNIDLPDVTSLLNTSESFSCYFPKMEMTVWFPGKPEEYLYGANTTWGKEQLKSRDGLIQSDMAPDPENTFVNMYTANWERDVKIACTFYLTYGNEYDIEDMTKEYVRGLSGLTGNHPMQCGKAGICERKDGTKVGLIIQKDETSAVILSANQNYIFYYTITATTNEELMTHVGLFIAAASKDYKKSKK